MHHFILDCFVVENSSIQRQALIKMVENHPNLRLVGALSNAMDTKTALKNKEVDLIFLDIELPQVSGFELLDNLIIKPRIIFLASQKKFAFKAFDYAAIDYLLKPVKRDRFLMSVEKALLDFKYKTDAAEERGDFIFIKSNLKKRKVYLAEIKYVQALGDYVKVITENENFIVLSTMKSFDKMLPKDQFLRIHKSYIINLLKVENYDSKTVELGAELLPLSRNRKVNLMEALA